MAKRSLNMTGDFTGGQARTEMGFGVRNVLNNSKFIHYNILNS